MKRMKRIMAFATAVTLLSASVTTMAFAAPNVFQNDNYDMNQDGILDAVDINQDGVVDYIDTDGDGIAETPVTDTDGDGIPDTHALMADSDGDGVPDTHAGAVDTTGDGNLDSIAPGPVIGRGASPNTVNINLAPGPVVAQELPIPQESISLTTMQLTNSLGFTLSYSTDNSTWSVGTTQNPIDLSAASESLRTNGVLYVKYIGDGITTLDSGVQAIPLKFPSLPKEATPQAVFDAANMLLSNMNVRMAYCFDGATWTIIGDGSPLAKTLTDDEANLALAHGIQVVKKGTENVSQDSDIQMIQIHKANAPDGVQGISPTEAGNSGKIINVNTSMQYRLSTSASWIDIGGDAVTGLASGDYLVRTRGSGVTIASDTVNVTISQYQPTQLSKEHTPGADFNAQIMVLSNIMGTKYSFDGGNNWTYAKDYDHVQVNSSDVHTDKGIIIYRPGNGVTTADSDKQTITLKKAGTPVGLGAISATSTSLGAITGLNTSMEYGPKGGSWTTATTNMVSIPAGVYYVRTQGAYTTLPSDAIEVDIQTVATPVVVTPIEPKATTSDKVTDTTKKKEEPQEEKKQEQQEESEAVIEQAETEPAVTNEPVAEPIENKEDVSDAIAEAEAKLAEITADEEQSAAQAATGTVEKGTTDQIKKDINWIWIPVVIMAVVTVGFIVYVATRKRRR